MTRMEPGEARSKEVVVAQEIVRMSSKLPDVRDVAAELSEIFEDVGGDNGDVGKGKLN